MLTLSFVHAKIAALEAERMQHFANWNRTEGALYAWREALATLEAQPNDQPPNSHPAPQGDVGPAPL